MEHDTTRLFRSYALVQDRHTDAVAENPAEYQSEDSDKAEPQDVEKQSRTTEEGVVEESVVTEPAHTANRAHTTRSDHSSEASTLPPDLVLRGQTLRLATALIEGASMASTDRRANADRLRVFSRVAAGSIAMPRAESTTESTTDPGTESAIGSAAGASSGSETFPESNKDLQESNKELVDRLGRLVRSNDRNMAEQLKLLVRIDELQLWKAADSESGGCRDCAQWMDRTLGICRVTALERLRVARALQDLAVIESLFALGKLSWSKVRELTRVADPACEQELVAAALELSASETVDLCQRWHHGDTDTGDPADTEAARALQAFQKRSLTSRRRDACTTRITLDLPHDRAAEFLKALEAQEDVLKADQITGKGPDDELSKHEPFTPPMTARQLRADAAVLMSARALAHLGEPVASADRYRVFVNIDARVLAGDPMLDAGVRSGTPPGELPPERPCIAGYGPVAAATARRLASQARLTVVSTDEEGDVVATGRDTRLFSPSAIRAITARDRCCQMPGCTRTRWLQAHHLIPWSAGGETTIANGCLICASCHLQLHEGNLRLERVTRESIALPEHEQLTMTSDEQSRTRAAIAAVQRFRLVRSDGRSVAGSRRRAGSCDRPSANLCRFEKGADCHDGGSKSRTDDEIDVLSRAFSGDQLEQYRVG